MWRRNVWVSDDIIKRPGRKKGRNIKKKRNNTSHTMHNANQFTHRHTYSVFFLSMVTNRENDLNSDERTPEIY